MADVELVLKVDNLNAITAIKETELAMAQLKQTAEGGGDEQIELLKKQISVLDSFKKKTKEAEITQEEYNEIIDDTAEKTEKAGTAIGGMGKKLSIIGAITTVVLGVLRGLVTAFKETTNGMDTATKAGTVFGQVMYNLVAVGKNAKLTMDEWNKSLTNAVITGKMLNEQRKQQISDMRGLSNLQAIYNKQLEAANKSGLNEKDRLKALAEANKTYNLIMDKKIANAESEYAIAVRQLIGAPNKEKFQIRANELEDILNKLKAERVSTNDELIRQEEKLGIEGEDYKKKKERYYKEIEDAEKLADYKVDLEKRIAKSRIEFLTGPERLEAEKKFAVEEIAIFKKAILQTGDWTPELEAKFQVLGMQIEKALEAGLRGRAGTDRLAQTALDRISIGIQDKLKSGKNIFGEDLGIQKFGGTPGKEPTTIWDTLGLNPDTEFGKENIDNARETANIIISIFDSIYAKRVEDAQRNRELADQKINETQNDLEIEIELFKAGYASNVAAKKMELAKLKEARDKALREEKKAIEDQRKLEFILQEISLATSAALLIEKSIQSNKNPILGLILAAAEIATMFIMWDAYKQQSITSTGSNRLAAGGSGDSTGMIKGKSHAAGGEHFLDHIEVEGGEKWGVLSKRASGKYGEMFDYMVDSFNKDQVPDIYPQTNVVTVDNNGSNTRLDQVISEQKKLNDQWSKEQHIILQGGRKIITKGNKTRIIG